MKIKPLLDRVVIHQDDAVESTPTGLIMPESAQEGTLSGIVVAVGEKATQAVVGDRVMYERNRGTNIFIKGEEYWIMREGDMLLIL